jgi:tetratricopeptide (TPR) repeat protein
MKKIPLFLSLIIILLSCSNSTKYKNEAEIAIKEKRYENALYYINKAIELDPDSANYYVLRGVIFDNTGRYKEELLDLDKIIELNKKTKSLSLNAHHQRGVIKTQLGLYNEALQDIDYFINNRDTIGSLMEAYLNKASVFYKLNDIKSSKKYYDLILADKVEKRSEIQSQALVGLANLTKDPIAALKLLNKAISIDPNNYLAFGGRAGIYIELNKIELAFVDTKKALSMNPNDPALYFNMGQIFANYRINNDSAIKYFEKAIEISPQSPQNDIIYTNLGAVKHGNGQFDDALSDFKKAESINPKNDILIYNMATLLSDVNRNDEALEKINIAIKINPTDAEYYNLKGTILLSKSSVREAEIEFKNAIRKNPNYGGAYYNLGYLSGELDNPEQSISYYNKAVLLNFNLEATLVNRALQKIKLNWIVSACDDLEKAYKLGRTDIKPLIQKYCNY